jgi:hypothetical protein
MQDREEFWMAAERVFSAMIAEHTSTLLEIENAYSARCLNCLLSMNRSIRAGEPPLTFSASDEVKPFDGAMIDLDDDLWFYEKEL